MDGIHDLGGMDGFGRVEVERDEPAFHEAWERRTWGVALALFASGRSNAGEFRHSIERMDPTHYLTSSYYEHWLTGVATLWVEKGVLSLGELEERSGGRFPLSAEVRVDAPEAGPDVDRPRFAVGDRVRVTDVHPRGHTRCPRYARGKAGIVVRLDGVASVPDVEAHSETRRHEPTYSVRFEAGELWGDHRPGEVVHVDLWESYLEPVRQ